MGEYLSENAKDIWTAIYQNYLYAFMGWMIPVLVTIVMQNDNRLIRGTCVLIVSYFFYSLLSVIINRAKYITNLGKYLWFPLPASIGALSAVEFGIILKTFL